MIGRIGLIATLALALAVGAANGENGPAAVDGVDFARVRIPAGVAVDSYENSGYRLTVDGDIATVEVRPSPLQSTVRFSLRPSAKKGRDPIYTLATALVSGAETRYDAVSRVLGWVSRSIEYDLDRTLPQDPEAVLARRSAYCTGVARLTVAILSELEIPSREVPGWVAGRDQGFHRWVEVLYEDRGWVFSDPHLSFHYVPATYVRLAHDEVEGNASGELLARQNRLEAVDLFPWGASSVSARKNLPRQRAAALQVRISRGDADVAVVEGTGSRWTRKLVEGQTTFLGVEPGRYTVRVYEDGRESGARRVRLEDRVREAVVFDLASQVEEEMTP